MKKLIPVLLVMVIVSSCTKEDIRTTEQPVSKTVNFQLSTYDDYSAAEHDSTFGMIELVLSKTIKSDYSQVVLFDTIFAERRLAEYMSLLPLTISKELLIIESKEMLKVHYSTAKRSHIPWPGGWTSGAASFPFESATGVMNVPVKL
jgi:hypothetical protein